MKNYNLSENEEKVLNVLELRESKTLRQVVSETSIFDVNIKEVLHSLEEKGLAMVHYKKHSPNTRWVAT